VSDTTTRRQPNVGDLAALPDNTYSGYRVRAANPAHRILLERTGDAGPLRIQLQPDQNGTFVLNGHALVFVSPEHRVCSSCEELFLPEDFGDDETCELCIEAAELDALETVAVPFGVLNNLVEVVEVLLSDLRYHELSELPSVQALTASLATLDKLMDTR